MLCKIIIALIATRNCHHRPCAVASKNIISNPYGNTFLGKWVNCVGPGKYSRNCFDIGLSFSFRALFGFFNIIYHHLLLFWSCDLLNQLQFGSQGHKAHSENGIGSGGENLNLLAMSFNSKLYIGSGRLSYPRARVIGRSNTCILESKTDTTCIGSHFPISFGQFIHIINFVF